MSIDPDAVSSVPDTTVDRDMVDVALPDDDGLPCAPDELVWLAAFRRGIPAHRLDHDLTRCGRNLASGALLKASVAADQWRVEWCVRCWPQEQEST